MITLTRFITVVMAVAGLAGLGTGSAAAETAGTQMTPLTAVFRSCDFTKLKVNAAGFGSGYALIGTGGSNTVTAEVHFAIGAPNTPYNVRLIQGLRPGAQTCNAGDPGVAAGVLNTDGNGTGALTLQAPIRSGATNAWVFVEGPPDPGQIRGEFYTSELVVKLN